MYAETLNKLIDELKRMPGIGPKSAQRLAFYVLQSSQQTIDQLVNALKLAKSELKNCSICYNITDVNPCRICADSGRENVLCVVAEPKDMVAIERSGEFRGRYHLLGGLISPLDGLGPESLRITELLRRIQQEKPTEIILAISPTVEGEATTIYLTRLLKPLGVNFTRLAYGLPIGADMDYADEATLAKSLQGRRAI